MKYFGLILLTFSLVACHKEEIAIEPHEAGEYAVFQAEMGQNYEHQIFFSLETNSVVSSNLKSEWDLGFESDPSGKHIVLNTSRGMAVHRSNLPFDAITDESGLEWEYDVTSGNLDSTAFGEWNQYSLFVIDLGYDENGAHLGYRKLQITSVNSTQFDIVWGDISDQTGSSDVILRDQSNTKFTYYKIGGGVVNIAPEDDEYDLIFTQYTHLFQNPLHAYVVTGVLMNRVGTAGVRIADKTFEEVDFETAQTLSYSTDISTIGYDWKEFDFNTSLYEVDPTITYVVQSHDGFYYKFHFVDFYNDQGIKGYPKMEIQKL